MSNFDQDFLKLIEDSGLFDQEWYLSTYQDVRLIGLSPIEHYLKYGYHMGRNPSSSFDGNWYLDTNPDVLEAGFNPLIHYLTHGVHEGRRPSPNSSAIIGCEDSNLLKIESKLDRYAAWLCFNQESDGEEARLREALAEAALELPVISVIIPIYQPLLQFLDEAVESVFAQIYEGWELCLYVDGDPDETLHMRLRGYAARDSRVKIKIGTENAGISMATNKAAKLASGQYIAFLDQDDILRRATLAEFALAVANDPDADILYSDDDKIDEQGQFKAPQFKPDWAPVLLLSYMYMSHLFVVRRQIFEDLGGFRLGFDGSQDYDFALRAAEKARKVVHIPRILYHWRVLPGSTATSGDAKPASFSAGQHALQEACQRRGLNALVYQPEWAMAAKVGIFSLCFPSIGPSVTIIIPTRNGRNLLEPCIRSIEEKTAYQNYRVMVIDNASDDPDTRQYLHYLKSCGHQVLRLENPNGKFNFAYLMNQAVVACQSEYVLLLNNDTLVRRSDWLGQMVGYAGMKNVGAVGAKLWFPDDTIQHAGIIHGLYAGLAGPAFRNLPARYHGYLAYTMVAREYSAVTAACLLTPRSLFLEIGGMNQDDFAVAYNDVDYCYRLISVGYSCIYCPDAELTHFEGKTRGFNDNALEIATFRKQYRTFRDTWYNPNLSLENENFQVQPWRYLAPQATKRPVRVVMVSHNLNHEGAPNSLFEIVSGLVSREVIDPVVITPKEGPLRNFYEKAGIEVQCIDHPLRNAYQEECYVHNKRMLATAWRTAGVELVYANTAQTFWAIDAAREAGLPAVWNIRESEAWQSYFNFLPPAIRAYAYAVFQYPYRVIFVAQRTRDIWATLNTRHNFTVIHNGIDLQRLQTRIGAITPESARARLNLSKHEVAVVLVGTVCDRKNQKVLISAFAKLPEVIASRARIFIVGDRDSAYSTELHQLKASLPKAKRDRVAIVPETDQPYLYYLAGDIAVCSSKFESYPRVVLEAMALGLSMICTPVFGITEQVSEGVNALLFPPEDVEALTQALTTLIDDDEKRSEMARNSKILFQGLTQYDNMLSAYGDVMRAACVSSPPLPALGNA